MAGNITALEPDRIYHVYNRAVGDEVIFINDDLKDFFLLRYREFIDPIADTYCYCLMPNHYHLLVRIKSDDELAKFFYKKSKLTLSTRISNQFGHLMNSYAKAFNKKFDRKGALFIRPYKRKQITKDDYLLKVVQYIHRNPVNANLADEPAAYAYSSYQKIISGYRVNPIYSELIDWFGDLDNFKNVHEIDFKTNTR